MRRLFFDGVFGLHVEFAGHLVAVVCKQIIVEGFVVAGYGASDRSGVRGEYGGDFRDMFADIQRTQAGHPFMCLVDDIIGGCEFVVTEIAFHKFACCKGKHRGFIIITVSMQRIDIEVQPCLGIDVILLGIKAVEVDEENNRSARDVPPSGAEV